MVILLLCTHKTKTNSIEIDLWEWNGIAQRDWVGTPTPFLL